MYASYEAAEPLAPFVECYWSWQHAPADAAPDPILPDAAPEFIVHLAVPPQARNAAGRLCAQPQAFLYCAASRPLELHLQGPMRVFAIRFRPWGVSRFHAVSIKELLDREIAPRDALGSLGDALVAALTVAGSDRERRERADELLLRNLEQPHVHDARLHGLLDAIDGGRAPAREIARRLAMSDRSFRRLWREVVGIEPRKFLALMRFHRALSMIDAGTPLAAVAVDCGYSDQAHLARQIKSISGLSPSHLRRRLGSESYRALYGDRPDAPWRPSGQ